MTHRDVLLRLIYCYFCCWLACCSQATFVSVGSGSSSTLFPRRHTSNWQRLGGFQPASTTNGDEEALPIPLLPTSLVPIIQQTKTPLQNAEEWNKALVQKGLLFDSHQRRFDFGGVWVRNSTQSIHVMPYLQAHGLTESQAHSQATRSYTQQYRRLSSGVFSIDTDFGRRTTIYELDKEWTELVSPEATLYGHFVNDEHESNDNPSQLLIRRRTQWKGDRHVTWTMNPNGSTECTTRYLDFNHANNWVLVVERDYTPVEGESIQCREIFERVYPHQQEDNDPSILLSTRSVLTSPLMRVPGCIANVKVRTILIPEFLDPTSLQNYRVWLDGESDAMVSRGLLALLSETLAGGSSPWDLSCPMTVTAQDVMSIDPDSIADHLGSRQMLTKGRNDGLASIMRIVQGQIQSHFKVHDSQDTPDTASSPDLDLSAVTNNNDGKKQPTVAMLLSGGVDSSVALNLLKRQNYNVTAFYLKIWLEDELAHLGQCPWEDDYRVCEAVCAQAGVPLETVSLQDEYKDQVISYTVHEAKRGRTPNPDIMCNARVKFGCFYQAIEDRGFDHVASGHYAQLLEDEETGQKRLFRAPDPVKDQSYFLCALTQDQLKRVLFPIGQYQKSEVRQLAEDYNLPNKQRPDSQGLCFLGKVKFDEFLAAYLGECPGDIVDASTGEIIGRHRGVWYHTVGQRKGIGKVLDARATSRGPWYVVAKNPERGIVFASNQYDEEAFTAARSDFYVEDIHWISGSPPEHLLRDDGTFQEQRFCMKIRHGPTIVEGSLELVASEAGNIRLDRKDGGLAPGQYVVLYSLTDQECLGGGVISERHWASSVGANRR